VRIHPEKETRKRKRIAFMLAAIHSGASTKVWPQILNESEKRQCALFVFPGGRLASHDEYEYMRNGIFDLVNACGFDGAISWASSLSGFTSEKQVEDFLLSRINIPLVTFGLKIGGMPVVNIDAYAGMKQLVFHLARRHSCRKIAYIGGPRAHSSAEERYKAYRDALDESGLRFDDRLASLDNAWDDGRKAMAKLLDESSLMPGVDFDAFCAASDLLAFEAAKLLQERGFRIPADIAMGGFNDSDESNLLSPTYTTVRMPFERQALQAFHMLIEKIDGREPADKMLKTKSSSGNPAAASPSRFIWPACPHHRDGGASRGGEASPLRNRVAPIYLGNSGIHRGRNRKLPSAHCIQLPCLAGRPQARLFHQYPRYDPQ